MISPRPDHHKKRQGNSRPHGCQQSRVRRQAAQMHGVAQLDPVCAALLGDPG
jgi:hypothetical protein